MLSEQEKAGLRPHLDIEALEDLVSRVPSAERERLIRFFSLDVRFRPQARGEVDGVSESIPQPVLRDPKLQALFDRVSQPARLLARSELRASYPQEWKTVERRFTIVVPEVVRNTTHPHATIHRRSARNGGDVVILPPSMLDLRSLSIAIEALMSDIASPLNENSRTEEVSLSSDKPMPPLTAEAERMVGALVAHLSTLPSKSLDQWGTGRTIDAWLLGSP